MPTRAHNSYKPFILLILIIKRIPSLSLSFSRYATTARLRESATVLPYNYETEANDPSTTTNSTSNLATRSARVRPPARGGGFRRRGGKLSRESLVEESGAVLP